MWHDHMWSGPWMMGWGLMPMLLFWVFVICVVVYLVRGLSVKDDFEPSGSALQILKDRLASGDIDRNEFDSLLKKIKDAQ